MTSRLLNESPIHVIDAIRDEINDGEYNPDTALLMLDLGVMLKKMERYDDTSIHTIANSNANETFNACISHQKNISYQMISTFVRNFQLENRTKIINDLDMMERKLLDIYRDSKIQVHRDT